MRKPGLVLGIHGLANKPPRDEKESWWQAAIREGLQRNCGFGGETLRFEFAYWADLRYDRPLSTDENREPYRAEDGTGPFPGAGSEDAGTVDTALRTLYKGVDWLQETTGVTIVDDLILEHRFDDLWHYHSETRFAQAVRDRFRDRIAGLADHRLLVVAHSMGSIIAYDTLRMLERAAPELRVEHFVTLGSPLGLSEVKLKVASENGAIRVPNNVGRWTNLADTRDVAAVAGALSEDYGRNDHGVGIVDVPVVNAYRRPSGEANPHKSYGYLRAPEFSRIVRDFASSR